MNKTALILAGAIAFDLGVVVVGGQAATTPAGTAPTVAPQASTGKHFPDYVFIKLDAVTSRQSCELKSGKVVDVKGIPMCQLPAPAKTTGDR